MTKLFLPALPTSPMYNKNNVMSIEWQEFFRSLFTRVGGTEAPTIIETYTTLLSELFTNSVSYQQRIENLERRIETLNQPKSYDAIITQILKRLELQTQPKNYNSDIKKLTTLFLSQIREPFKYYLPQTVWEDLNFDPVRSGGPVANRPDDVTIDNCYYKEFTSANNQSCGDNQEVPHKAKIPGTLKGHLHCFLKSGESAGTTGVTFTVYWSLRQSTGLTTGNFTLSATSAELTANPDRFDIYDSIGFGVAEKGAQLGLALYRTAGDAGDVIVTTYGIHYEIDTVGSRTLLNK
ncbi:MAG: hypothetical protein PH343_10120 [Nitrospira sp.]|nr:hypothetical protein [Nitrospira sp.]